MKKSIFNLLFIVGSISLVLFVSDCTCQNIAFGAEDDFPEQFLSQTVEWEKCELFENQNRLRKAECANITVPLYWETPEGETITIHVKRLKALAQATKQMWLLEGGPYGDGTSYFSRLAKTISQLDGETDLYMLDPRGGGYSHRLTCPDQEADDSEAGKRISENEWDACIDYLEANYNLDAFTVTQSAKDLGFLIELLKGENKNTFVYGDSYGTYWAHRYAQIFPDQVEGIILDSVATPVYIIYDKYDMQGNNVAEDFFDICKEDEFCSSKMGDNPWSKANDAFDRFRKGHCNEIVEHGLTPELLQNLAFTALDFWYLRIVLPALYYRLDRCSEGDVRAIKHMWNIFSPLLVPQSEGWSSNSNIPRHITPTLFFHISLSELMPDNPMSIWDCEETDKTLLTSQHFSCLCLRLLEKWPTYETDVYYEKWASQDVPILMLHGTLDPKTTIEGARVAKENLNGPNQYFIEMPNAVHGVCWKLASPVKNIFAPDCGMQIMLDYIKDPLTEPDTSCRDDLRPIDFRGNPLMALVLFGTWDIWENGINTTLSDDQISLMKEEVEKIKQDLRQRWSRLR